MARDRYPSTIVFTDQRDGFHRVAPCSDTFSRIIAIASALERITPRDVRRELASSWKNDDNDNNENGGSRRPS